ncbi:MFS transporter [Sphaerisporangium rubeum]
MAVSLATFMTYLDNNVVNVALPTIQRDLGLTISGLEWIVSGYILVFAGLLLAGGRLADVFGQRRIFVLGLVVFSLASTAAGLSTDGTMLVLSRGVQGVGAALLTPTALSLIPRIFPDTRERNTAVGLWSAVGALALAFGPLTGGFISENWHWGWIYLINVPIGALTLALGLWALPRDSARSRGSSLDLPGLAASATALFALTYALIEGESQGWTSAVTLGSFAVAAAAAALFVMIERRVTQPMIDLSLFRERVFSGGLTAMGLWAFGVFGIYFFTALWLQNVLGYSPIEAGSAFIPMALLMAAVATVAPRLAARFGTAPTVAAGLALMSGSVLALSFTGADGAYRDLLPWFLMYGLGAGLLVPLTNAILDTLQKGRAGVASGTLNVSREVFGLLGITVLGAILNARQNTSLTTGATPLTAFLDGYQLALTIAAAIMAVGVPLSLLTLRRHPVSPVVPEPPKLLESVA